MKITQLYSFGGGSVPDSIEQANQRLLELAKRKPEVKSMQVVLTRSSALLVLAVELDEEREPRPVRIM